MGRKVSMVVCCYNKELYADAMLRSIYEQSWDDIELVLVNDGSTDKTPEILRAWEPKMRGRGYEVILIDQPNTGVRGAFKRGLDAITGDYFCSLDADDNIEPDYVTTLAGFLEENPEYEWSSCDYRIWDLKTGECRGSGVPLNYPGEGPFFENYFLSRTYGFTWIYMVRTRYMRRCRVAENFGTVRNAIHEQDLILPLLAGGGRNKHIDRPLYNYYLVAGGLSQPGDYEKKCLFFEDWAARCKESLLKLNLGETRTQALEKMVEAGKLIRQWQVRGEFSGAAGVEAKASGYIETLHRRMEAWAESPFVPPLQNIPPNLEDCFFRAVQDVLAGVLPPYSSKKVGRIVAWGTLGKAGKRRLATLAELDIRPDILWDAAARGEQLYGKTVEKPRPETLRAEDILLVLPTGENAVVSIRGQIEAAGAHPFLVDTPFAHQQFIGHRLFPQLYTADYGL